VRKILSTILLATLVLSVVAVAGVVPVRAAVVGTFEPSSKQFYGNAVIQLKLYDPDLTGQENVTITWNYGYGDVPVNLTSPLKNGEFFGYFMNNSNVDDPSNPVSPVSALRTNNNGGNVTQPPYGSTNLPVYNATINKGTTITFKYLDSSPVGTVTESVTYDEYKASVADITFDRSSLEYPMNGWIRVYVKDLDWNLDPTAPDAITGTNVSFISLGETLLGTITSATETDSSTGIFRFGASYTTNSSVFAGTMSFTGQTSGSMIKVSYANETDAPSRYITIKTFPVTLIVDPTFTTRGDLTITLTDPNLNLNSWSAEYLNGTIYNTYINVSMGNDFVLLNPRETAANSGMFQVTVPVVIGNANTGDNTLQVAVGQTSAIIKYYYNSTSTVKAETVSTLSTTPAQITSDKTMYRPNATVTLTITAPDLNDDVNNPNFFTCSLPSANDTISSIPVYSSGQIVGNLTVKVNGLLARTDSGTTLNFVENGVDTNVFTTSLSLARIFKNDNTTLANGDSVQVSYYDAINKATSSVTFTIGVAAASISLDRSTYPVPRDGNVQIRVTVTDSEANTDSATIQTRTAYLDVYYYNGTWQSSYSRTVTETGPNTGVFTGEFSLPQSAVPAFINGWVKALYVDPASGKNITATATLVATDAAISVDKATVKAGDKLTVTVTDADNNLDSKNPDRVTINVEYTDSAGNKQTPTWTLYETDVNTGVFTISKTIGSDIKVKPGSTITLTYNDTSPSYITATAGYPSSPVVLTATAKVATHTGTISIDKAAYGLGSKMTITVNDPDLNTDTTAAQSTTVTLRISGYPDETRTLNEDGANSAVFTATYTWNSTDTGLIGKTFQIYYKDDADANGNTVYAVATGTVNSWDAQVSFDKAYYNVGDIATITVNDPDANRNPSQIETKSVTVTSDSDPIGQTITVTETDVNTGVFTGKIQISSSFAPGKVYAKVGDTLTAKYTDALPADYADTGKSKVFTGTAIVGVPVARPVPASSQKFVDPNTGAEMTAGTVGQAIGLQATVKNVDVVSKTFIAIFKVKDASDVTISISWVTGTLAPGQELTPGVSWTPSAAGTYKVEVLVFKTLAEPTPYSEPLSKTLTVS
jgi:hypothetical protein